MTDNTDDLEIDDDGFHCSTSCPFLKPDELSPVDGICLKDNSTLSWYDYYLANCSVIEEENENEL